MDPMSPFRNVDDEEEEEMEKDLNAPARLNPTAAAIFLEQDEKQSSVKL